MFEKKRLCAMTKKLPRLFRNFYFLGILFFVVWMFFFDSNDLVSRYQLGAKLRELENEKEYYQQKINEVKKDQAELMGNRESLEKFAREKYLMKKENEDIFIIEEKK
jgi:cell division protein DivIC